MGSSIENLTKFIDQVRNNNFQGFTVDLGASRSDENFERFVEFENVSGLELNNAPERFINKDLGQNSFLEGRKVGVFGGGQKLFETVISKADLRFGGGGGLLRFDNPENVVERLEGSLPQGTDSLESIAENSDLKSLSFRPVETVKDRVPDNFEGALPGPDKAKEKVKGMNLGLILPVVAGLTVVYLVIFE